MLETLLNFLDFCLKIDNKFILYIYKEGKDFFQKIDIINYEYQKDHIIFESHNEDYLIPFTKKNLDIVLKPFSKIQYSAFQRELLWGKNILFEIKDYIHNKEIVFSIGSDNKKTIASFIQDYVKLN